jgi:hypothetical protein
LSAKYGFLFPDEIIPGPYEVTFKKKGTNPVSSNVLSNQVQGKGLSRFDKIIALGGKVNCDLIDDLFRGKTVSKPLAGRTLGQAMKLLNEAINRKVPF